MGSMSPGKISSRILVQHQAQTYTFNIVSQLTLTKRSIAAHAQKQVFFMACCF